MTEQQCITGCGRDITSGAYSLCDGCWEILKPNDDPEICDCGVELITTAEQSMEACWLCKREEINELAQNPLGKGKGKKNKSLPWKIPIKSSESQCTHTGMPMVFKIGKGKVYASGSRDVKDWDWSKLDLIVSLNGHPTPLHKANDAALKLLGTFYSLTPPADFARLSMTWVDGAAPPFEPSYVKDLVALVAAGTDILIHCVGGHGRTGTMLVAMLCELAVKPWGKKTVDPIKWIRTNYCKRAVETDKQIDWLKDRYDIVKKTKETSSDPHTAMGSWGNHYAGGL